MRRSLYGNKGVSRLFAVCFLMLAVLLLYSRVVFADSGLSLGAGKALGGDMFNSVVLLSHSFGAAIQPISILFIEALVSLGGKAFPDTLGQYSASLGFMNSTPVSVLIIVLFVLLKLPKSMMPTRVFGIAVGDIENHVMAVFNFAMPFIIMFGDPSKYLGIEASSGTKGLAVFAAIVLCIVVGLVMTLSYWLMRTVTYALEILATAFSPIPFLSLFIETAKTVICAIIVILAMFAPHVLIAIYVLDLVVCIIMFAKAYNVSRYFRKVYVAGNLSSKAKRARIAVSLQEKYKANGEAEIFCYAGMYLNHNVKKYSKCKLVIRDKGAYLTNHKLQAMASDNNGEIRLVNSPETPYHIRKGLRFIEIYIEDKDALPGKGLSKLRPNKRKFSLVISNEYSEFFNDLVRITEFTPVYEDIKKPAVTVI